MRVSIGKLSLTLAAVAAIAAGGVGVASAAGGSSSPSGSRLDDGKQYLPQAKVSEQDAIAAAQQAATGDLNEVDLEYYNGHLAWNVDVGSKNVKVDAGTGKVLDASHAD
jgi:uncharacterized membrane protein YkoI